MRRHMLNCEKCELSSVFLPELSHAVNAHLMIYLLPTFKFCASGAILLSKMTLKHRAKGVPSASKYKTDL